MANIYERAITLDVSARENNVYIAAKQGDDLTRTLRITLTRDGNPFSVADGSTVEIRCLKPSGYICDNPAVLNQDGTVTATLTEQCLAEVGLVKTDIAIRDGSGNVLSTATFFIDSLESGSNGKDIQSANELLILNGLIKKAEESVDIVADLADRADQVLEDINTSKAAAAQSAASAAGSAQTATSKANEAAQSATSAGTAKTAAETAQTAAVSAKNAAESAKTAAVTAQGKAEAAQSAAETAADTASTKASAAATSANAAATSASEAATSKADAEKAKAAAQTAQSGAETAKSGAVTAQTAAANSASDAAGSATAAANSASAAAGSASTAASHKTAAEQAKTAAQTAQSEASSAKDDAVAAKTAAETAQSGAVAAKNAAVTAQGKAETAQSAAETAKDDAVNAKTAAATSASAAATSKTGAETAASNASGSASAAANSASAAANSATAAATAKQSAESAAASAASAAEEKVAEVVGTVPKKQDGSDQTVMEYINDITAPRFGVSGVGGSAAALTRLWDSVGKTVTVSTDTVTGSSGFDNYAPFNRKKCVGSWTKQNGKAKFNVAAYYGDADYTEDGSMGDYVAVEVKPFYYYEKDGILGVSEQQYPGWKIHPVCVDYDGNIRENTYLPVYALAKNAAGNAVSLPGLYNLNGAYKTLWDSCKTYADADAGSLAILEPSAVNHYEWLLMVIEFGTQNIQSYMQGCAGGLPHADSNTAVATPAANKVVVGSWGSGLVVGQTITFTTNIWDGNGPSSYNVITALQKCNADGTLNSSGSYWLVTYDGTNRTATAGTTKVVSRPWRTGCCTGALAGINAVKGHTGYPISNNGKYPCMYRFRELTYGNQYNTSLDMADTRIADGDSFHLEWYFLADPRKYTPSSTSKPDATDLNGVDTGWVKLNVITPVSSYVNGYIKKFEVDEMFPHIKVPVLTTGGGSTTYYCDSANLVTSNAVRSVRRGGFLGLGASAGPCYMHANAAPSAGSWDCGGALHFLQ